MALTYDEETKLVNLKHVHRVQILNMQKKNNEGEHKRKMARIKELQKLADKGMQSLHEV